MPVSPFETAGAQIQPTSAAPLHTNEFFTGLWTHGNPLGPGAVPYLYTKFYSASRFDRLVGGNNVEISTKLTLMRRPGSSVYNSAALPPINRFYEFRSFTGGSEVIHIVGSADPGSGSAQPTVRDVTGPANNLILWTKNANAGRTSFVSVGNRLYFGDGIDTGQWIQSALSWKPNTTYNAGDFIVDENNDIQVSIGAWTGNITSMGSAFFSVPGHTGWNVDLFFSSTTPVPYDQALLTLAGLTFKPALNGLQVLATRMSPTWVRFFVANSIAPIGAFAQTVETGTASTGTGPTGSSEPIWQAPGQVTLDNQAQWDNKGPAVMPWGIAAPAAAPIVTQALAPSVYNAPQTSTWYAPLFVILDANGNLEQLSTAGTTGGTIPTFSTTVGAITADGTAAWKNIGPAPWAASTAYALNACIQTQFTYYVTQATVTYVWQNGIQVPVVTYKQVPVTITQLFQCVQAGTTGVNVPSWTNGLGTTVNDGTAAWKNMGKAPAWIGATQKVSLDTEVLDPNGYLQKITAFGETGATAPTTWETDLGSSTVDGSQTWLNVGSYAPAATAAVIYAYSGKNSVTGQIGTASPQSVPITVLADNNAVIQGGGLAGTGIDTIVLWRTVQGGSTLLYDDEFPNPGPGQTWIYTDSNPDSALNELITAPIANANDPPPAGFIPQCYYLGRIWGFVGNVLKNSAGPDTTVGSGNESFAPLAQFTFPSLGVKCWGTSIGLIVYTNSDIWAVLGQGTINSPFYVVMFQEGVGLASQDAFCVNGSTAYGMLTSGQVVSMDPGAGEVEVGFPIGDQFDSLYTAPNTYCAWHQGSSADTALYVADGATGWFRMAPVAAPESGNVWSPQAVFAAGIKAIASIEISPGVKRLILGPSADGHPILMRDKSVHSDNAANYQAFAIVGSIVMAQPGTTVGVQYVVLEEEMIAGASAASLSVMFDEIAQFDIYSTPPLRNQRTDPPNLPASKTVRATRYWIAQDANTVQVCRHMQQKILWPAENFPNELLTATIFGRLPEKARK
jgi:hypothetical protein